MKIENDDKVAQLERELAESKARENDLIKSAQIRQVLGDKGLSQESIGVALPIIESQISRTAEGGLAGVDGALSYLAKIRPELLKTKVASNASTAQPLGKSYAAPTPSEEAYVRKYVGPTSDSRLANLMALENPREYARVRQLARQMLILG